MTTTIESAIRDVFDAAEADGCLHAREIDGDREAGLGADDLVVTASVFKVPVLVELARRMASGELDPIRRVRVTAEDRVIGPTGLSVFRDDCELSVRDLALSMITVSDNTATDVVMRIVGIERVNATMRALGVARTHLVGDCRELLDSIWQDLGFASRPEYAAAAGQVTDEQLRACRSLRPDQTNRTTPREMTRLLTMVWRDEAGTPEACAEVRRIMSLQVWPHRLTAGFPDGVAVSGKTGTLPGIRNEVGVVQYPDGGRFAVAVFTRSRSLAARQPAVDRAIGHAARLAVESLRG